MVCRIHATVCREFVTGLFYHTVNVIPFFSKIFNVKSVFFINPMVLDIHLYWSVPMPRNGYWNLLGGLRIPPMTLATLGGLQNAVDYVKTHGTTGRNLMNLKFLF